MPSSSIVPASTETRGAGLLALWLQALRNRDANHRIVEADDGVIGARDEPLLDRRVIFHRAVPVEMIRRHD